MIKLHDLTTTQLSVRNHSQVLGMAKFVRNGGFFDRDSLDEYARSNFKAKFKSPPLIQINQFEDGKLFVLDGHHRGIGILEGGRDYISKDEYGIIKYTYKEFNEIVFLWPNKSWMGWVTPFDPRERVRLPNTKNFKDEVKRLYYENSPEHAIAYIDKNIELYSTLRRDLIRPIDTIEQLRNIWKMESDQLKKITSLR